ncbi:hypothetical protein ATY75_12270 [Rhizobium sp. N122]|uniref:hypothetical protein n=1 Tax=Rhizobium sp. N122 TaxID=1764272 RepID=UPI000B5A3D1F|nr:hypothetical protein [Rhizobium sp. N122]OWV62592.1 hypothetical protein ATY75_12270 [Rhizobium sp. N122]
MASLLPTGETTFLDANGIPLASGTVEFYIPGTTTPKDTWQNASQTILNTNPVTLDSAGRAIIYGSGSYRQVVKDSLGNLVWDQETAEPNSGAVSFGGTSSGTANAQTLSAAQFSGIDGQVISFVAGISNSGPMTISVGGSSPIPVLKNSPAGPVALVAGDIVQGNSYFVQYSTALSSFQLLLSVAPSIPTGPFLRGYLWGLTLSNNVTDAVNDIDISAGAAGSDGATPVLMTLSSAITKRADAAWAVGSGNGWLDTGSIADGTYSAYIIQRSDTGVVDSLLSLSPTAPTMPAAYDRKRRIGYIIRQGGTIIAFIQNGDEFRFVTRRQAISAVTVSPATSTITLAAGSVPNGVAVEVHLAMAIAAGSNIAFASFNSLDETDTSPGSGGGDLGTSVSSSTLTQAFGRLSIRINTSRQIRGTSFASASVVTNAQALGWSDDRGRTS